MSGWIKLHRSLLDHWLSEDPERLGAWVQMLMLANHSDRKVLIGNSLVLVKRGSFVTSKRNLQKKFGWSREKLDAFFTLIRSDQMATYESTCQYTHVSITNYDSYQETPHTEPHTDRAQIHTQPAHEPTTNKNDQELKNEIPPTPLSGEPATKRRTRTAKYRDLDPTDFEWPPRWQDGARAALKRWIEYKAKSGEPCILETYQAQVRKFADNPRHFAALVDRASEKGWKGLNEELPLDGIRPDPNANRPKPAEYVPPPSRRDADPNAASRIKDIVGSLVRPKIERHSILDPNPPDTIDITPNSQPANGRQP